jgi:rhodanese-related sulfurtransferase
VAVRTIGLLLLAITVSACSEPPYTNVDNRQLETLLAQGVALYDIRRPPEWRQTGVLEGSRLLTFVADDGRLLPGFFDTFTGQTARGEPLILICRTGSRTRTLARYLVEELGYTQVYNLRGGILDWIREGGPVTRVGQSASGSVPGAGGAL